MDETLSPPGKDLQENEESRGDIPISLEEEEKWFDAGDGSYFSIYKVIIGGQVAGDASLVYLPQVNKFYIESMHIIDSFQNKGYGKRIYEMIAALPLPSGNRSARFISSKNVNENALRVWHSLEKESKAFVNDEGRYEFKS